MLHFLETPELTIFETIFHALKLKMMNMYGKLVNLIKP